eukprot:scaffold200412_cov46-Tisochrysis_lutea.AAC.1
MSAFPCLQACTLTHAASCHPTTLRYRLVVGEGMDTRAVREEEGVGNGWLVNSLFHRAETWRNEYKGSIVFGLVR